MSKYEKLDQIDHVLKRPDVYIGSTRSRNTNEFVVVDNNKIEKKNINISPAILRIFIEPLSNVVDNFARSKQKGIKASKLEINIDEKTGETSFWNDGEIIPIEIHPIEKCYNHSLIFGQLLTSSNYNDDEDRIDISGKNGIGIKATGIFSKKITVEGVDPVNEKHFIQTWTNNLKSASEPKVTVSKLKKGYTKVSYIPDFAQFELKGYTSDILSLYKRYVIDVAMLTKMTVIFNEEELIMKSLQDYAKLYSKIETDEYLYIKTANCEVVTTPSFEFESISFANGIFTPLGGTHVDAWSEALFRPLVEKLNKPKKPQINIADVKKFFRLFVVASVNKPSFDSQSKLKLESPTVEAEVKRNHIATLAHWSVFEMLEDLIRMKEMVALKKVERKKGFQKIAGLSPANNEGGKLGRECILAIVEGESAKTFASYGLKESVFDKQGRDWIGIYPIRGKILNTRNANVLTISKNTVICEIIQALGLQQNLDYTLEENFKKLRYGKLLIITDADVDGFHISGLIQNFFHSLFPSLLKRKESFLSSMQTPIVRVYSENKDILFYDENDFRKYAEEFRETSNKKIKCKYYKGLGASNKKDVIETFGRKVINFHENEADNNTFTKVFHKKFTDQRKEWLEKYDSSNTVLKWNRGNEHETKELSYSDFINTEMIKFSISDCNRSIPHLIDGFKEGHRKVLYGCFKRKMKYNGKVIKVSQLSGIISDISAYHHGEQNLFKTITHMASQYVGCNNIPLLYRDGQFGSRAEGGKDAANARYISTKLDMLTRLIFRIEDEPLLNYKEDDGRSIEPEFYVPIIPLICVNGCITGIGTGWSCNVPCYNPIDIIEAIKVWLNNDGNIFEEEDGVTVSLFSEIKPWYHGFKGEIKLVSENKYLTYGVIEETKNGCKVTELPIGLWISDFEDQLASLKEEKIISDYKNHSDPDKVDFTIIEDEDGIKCDLSNLKLISSLSTNNMVLFNAEGKLKKYPNVESIIDEYCKVRFDFYVKRKHFTLMKIEKEILQYKNKKRFLSEICDGTIKLFNENKKDYIKTEKMIEILNERKYDKEDSFKVDLEQEEKDDEEDDEKEEKEEKEKSTKNDFEYLLRMQINSITEERVLKLKIEIENKEQERDILKNTSVKDIWIKELDELLKSYLVFKKELDNESKSERNEDDEEENKPKKRAKQPRKTTKKTK